MARQSVYPTNAIDLLNHLDDCVNFTEASAASLNSSLGRFEPGIRDLPRLTKILANKHHYLVLPTTHVQSHQSAISHSLAPQIEALIAKAETIVTSQARKVANLEERLSIVRSARAVPVAAPIPQPEEESEQVEENEEGDGWGSRSKLDGLEMKDLTVAQRRKIIMLRGKRERLERERRELMGDEEDEGF